jgi:hypothetical protein
MPTRGLLALQGAWRPKILPALRPEQLEAEVFGLPTNEANLPQSGWHKVLQTMLAERPKVI